MTNSNLATFVSVFNRYAPRPPLAVISTGVIGFFWLTYLFSWINPSLLSSWAFSPNKLVQHYDPSTFTTYPLIHSGFFHVLFNSMALYYPLSEYEVSHGSLHTALVINTLGAILAITITVISIILVHLGLESPDCMDNLYLGSSGWVFTFITVSCCHRSINDPYTVLFNHYNVPTVFIPLVYLLLSAFLFPSSSFIGHLVSIILGFLIFKKIIALLTIPPFQILNKIESLSVFHNAIEAIFPKDIFVWTWENEVLSSRYTVSDFSTPLGLPLHHGNVDATTQPPFKGPGEKLGSSSTTA
ncbi:hypothetical protein CAS74_004913 [Pichia kudriavzevii]|uniref:Rhomboid-type serine protease 2 n=1 Tax=Pichia kudriavzevii TaxID=4909 RepID=A0A099P9M4_PICKU|nr:hypothetical protein JL09_g228 [Pichia kudriavzevii]OUT20171.1 hypothetical protein CAS74_004913 [Pichia kudriavzevii]